MTTTTITKPTKKHLERIKTIRELSSLNETIQSILRDPVDDEYDVADANTQDDPATVKISDNTQSWLKSLKKSEGHSSFDDLLREKSGATPRDHGEEPIEWEPLDA